MKNKKIRILGPPKIWIIFFFGFYQESAFGFKFLFVFNYVFIVES